MATEKKTKGEQLSEKLLSKKKNAVLRLSEKQIKEADSFCEGYKNFMNTAKIEREAVIESVRLAREAGFKEYVKGKKYKAGDKFYYVNRAKAIVLGVIGKDPLDKGIRLAAAHIDSPRLDLKQNPLYEDKELCLFKTHYYGGIKKYQWTAIPMALHGVIIKSDGEKVSVNIGEDEKDPVFCVTDILPHLASEQMKRNLAQGIKGEELNLLIGFMLPDSGELLIDGQDISTINLRSYRRFLSVVPQTPLLFTGTLRDNITYGLRDVSEEEIRRALACANLTKMVENLPNGIDTVLEEHGANLSGGQRQRIAIARAIIRDPRVIILDEATSALDVVSEKEIQDALESLVKDRTTFIVAHRLSTIRNADWILVMDKGIITEAGTYEELLDRKGMFYHMESLQMSLR